MTTSSSDVADEEQFFFTHADAEDQTEEQILQRKEQYWKKETEWVLNEEPSSMKLSVQEFTNIEGNTTSYSINLFKPNAGVYE